MSKINTLVRNFAKDEDGGELLEYALIAGLIVIAAIAAMKVFSGALQKKFNDMSTDMNK